MRTVLILMDSLNRRFLPVYNTEAEGITPNIDKFAKDCVRFDNHFIGSAPCMPARRDIMTGRLQFLERSWGPVEPFDVTLPGELRKNGIFTHITTDHHHYFEIGGENYCQLFDTWDFHRGQESDPWISRVKKPALNENAYGRRSSQHTLNYMAFSQKEENYPTPRTFRSACQWAEANRGCDNFFLMVEAFDPHEPFETPPEYLEQYHDTYQGPEFNWPGYTPVTEPAEAVAHLKKSYLAALTMADKWFGKFIDCLKQNGLYRDTLILFTTDHGHMLGEHGYISKNFMHAYNELSHLPLLVKMPGESHAGECRKQLTQNIDLMPTILEYHQIPVPESVKGKSLLSCIEKQTPSKEQIIYGWFGRAVNVYDGRYTYFRAPKDAENQPCYQYCGIPSTLGKYLGTEHAGEIQTGRFLPYTDYPVYKIPAREESDWWGDLAFVRNSLLFDLQNDYLQEHPVKDSVLEEEMCKKLAAGMREAQAPEEQYERLGLAGEKI